MPKCSRRRNYGKTSEPPRRPYEKERLDQEMKLLGAFVVVRGDWGLVYCLLLSLTLPFARASCAPRHP